MLREISVIGVMMWNATDLERQEARNFIKAGLSSHALQPVVEAYPLREVQTAHRELRTPTNGGAAGRLVLSVD